ncbi:OmpH family outer membrane protein [Oleidesulfovibrio sp.]|uniref:OmpH family outer membrane protein n=1 Tax=Oleidesulfovibrio sp. TaxID=2909707 RepID=UPI003A88911C
MRKILLALVALSLFAAAPAHAQQPQKIGLINLQKLMLESAPAAEAKKKMEANFSAEKKEIDKKSEELKKMSEQLRLQSAALTPEAREDKKVDFVRMKRDLEDQARTFTRKVQAADAQIRQDILTVIAKACSEYGKKQGFAAIFDATHAGVAYADPALDVTSEVMVEVNRIWRAGAKK